ncbi:hypothetical protein CKAN_02619700 [Cinnamomum micranthum f. kanehirae]|uniref:DUF674 domain-containing protein n=1 Tax=Cinnamomum micranthum f. kanehirae TaxID=337451 RepID=A0A3S3PSG1_9MAGN|nr:hypothetical protein CKAN_02619700 [Cinnamomum micranthum f. kanehirae]
MATTPIISLKLVVDKKMNRVVFAESDNDFVDVLLSFLTMPIGTIIRLTGKESKIGGMSTLYESVEDLDVSLLQTEACKKMLLYPKNSSEEHCKNLKVNVDDTEPTKYYVCSWDCCAKKHQLVSTFYNAQCGCGQSMKKQMIFNKKPEFFASRVFVKGNMRFIIRDDLQVFPVSMNSTFTLLDELGISDASVLEERNVNIGSAEVLHLLNRSLLSKTPLTDVLLLDHDMIDRSEQDSQMDALHWKDFAQPQEEKGNGSNSKKISVKLTVRKSNKKVVYAEGGEEFADLLFSFLAFPMGFVPKFFGGDSGIKCLDNLYRSVQVLKEFIKSEECEGLLVDPNLGPYFSCKNQPLQIKEQNPWQPTIIDCYCSSDICGIDIKILDYSSERCRHGTLKKQLFTINPKYPSPVKELGGSFIAGPAMFLVTDELNVKQHSPMSGISLLTKLNISMIDLEEHVVSVGEVEAASLLKASLISKSVLTDVFYHKKPKPLGAGIKPLLWSRK